MRFLRRIGRKDEFLRLGPDHAEQRRPQHQTRQQIAHQRGLAQTLHALAQDAADQKQQHHFGDQKAFGLAGAGRSIAGRRALARARFARLPPGR